MADGINDGGPAFPVPLAQTNDGGVRHASEYGNAGMTLRDYFAAKAMHAVMVTPTGFTVSGADHVAQIAYEMADAMLKARQS